jgi:hypothetical protein
MKERSLSRGAEGSFGISGYPDDGELSTDGRANVGPRITENRREQSRPAGGRPEGKPRRLSVGCSSHHVMRSP